MAFCSRYASADLGGRIFVGWVLLTTLACAIGLFALQPVHSHHWLPIVMLVVSSLGTIALGTMALRRYTEGLSRIEADQLAGLVEPMPSEATDDPVEDRMARLRASQRRLRKEVLAREMQLHQLAFNCALTGLANRQHFHATLEAHLRQGEGQVAVVLIDLNHFKAINDGIGHAAGDGLLRDCAKRLALVARALRVRCLARLDGDEFALLLDVLPSENALDDSFSAVAAADTVHRALEAPFHLGLNHIDLRASIGIALSERLDASQRTATDLMRHADVALTASKSEKLPTVCYKSGLDVHERWHLSLLGELKVAMQTNCLALHIQPKMDLRTGRITSGEALLRWTHPSLGLVPPSTFIGYAEKTGYIREITSWAIEEGVMALAMLREHEPDFALSINLSGLDLHTVDLTARLVNACRRHLVPPHSLTLEITEGSLVNDIAGAIEKLDSLSKAGFKLSIDDFGTGYSSLSYLANLPLSELKVDQSFVRQINTSTQHATIANWVVQIGLQLGLHVVAEGVESLDLLARLKSWGCHAAQGFAISRPLPVSAMLAVLREQAPVTAPGAAE